MKFLQELVQFKRIDAEDTDEIRDDEGLLGDELSPEDESDDELSDGALGDELSNETSGEEGMSSDDELVGGEDTPDDFSEEMPEEPSEPEDPNRQGMIRTVKGAHLVYKREVEDGTFEELWQYNTSTLRDEITVRKAILAGTDIPVNKAQSPDGSQSFETWAAGNAELMLIRGLQQ